LLSEGNEGLSKVVGNYLPRDLIAKGSTGREVRTCCSPRTTRRRLFHARWFAGAKAALGRIDEWCRQLTANLAKTRRTLPMSPDRHCFRLTPLWDSVESGAVA